VSQPYEGTNGRRLRCSLAARPDRTGIWSSARRSSPPTVPLPFLASMTSSRPSTRRWQNLTFGFPPCGRARRETSVSTIDHGPDSPPTPARLEPPSIRGRYSRHSHRPYRPVDHTVVLSGPDRHSACPRALRGSPACHRRPDSRTLVSRVGRAWQRADHPNMYVHWFLGLDRAAAQIGGTVR